MNVRFPYVGSYMCSYLYGMLKRRAACNSIGNLYRYPNLQTKKEVA